MATHLITGCAGFVGSHLTRALLGTGAEVYGVDSLIEGYKENIADLRSNPNFHFVRQDIRDISPQTHTSIDYIWHLAAAGATYFCRDFPKVAVLININGTISMLDIAINSKCKHFFFADSSSLYDSLVGDEYYPSTESMAPNTKTPMGIYAITKMAASQLVRSFGENHSFGTSLFRYTNIYGPSMNLKRDIPPVVGSFTSKLLTGETPIIYGTGQKRRDFLHIDDLTNFHLHALDTRCDEKDTQTYNAGSGENFSISEVYEVVHAACKKIKTDISDEIEYRDDQPNEAQVTLADISKANNELGWQPEISFEDGVEKTVKSLNRMLGDSNAISASE